MIETIAKKLILEYFGEELLDAIYNAMADYQDHGEKEADHAHQVQSLLTQLYK